MKIACAIVLGGLIASPASAAILHAQLLPLTGEVRLRNTNPDAVPFVFYSIKSPGGALNGAASVWTSITTSYDAPIGPTPGNGFVDPNGQWIKLTSQATELAEGALDSDGGRLPARRGISLGRIWNSGETPVQDLSIDVRELSGSSAFVIIEQAVDGDFNGNGVVDAADYAVWRNTLFTVVDAYSAADGNGNGVVDTADYLIWRANFGARLPGRGIATFAGTLPVPAPSTFVLFIFNAAALVGVLRRRSLPAVRRDLTRQSLQHR
jgi:hypothetical protein